MNNVHHKQANKTIITTNIANSSEIFLSKKKKYHKQVRFPPTDLNDNMPLEPLGCEL